MLGDKRSSAILAVSDLERAKQFYGETLGLELAGEPMGVLVYRTGDTELVVYPSATSGTNRANAAVWACGDELDDIVADLRSKGVEFEHYEIKGLTYDEGVHRAGDFGAVWLKDPDGNILHLNSSE